MILMPINSISQNRLEQVCEMNETPLINSKTQSADISSQKYKLPPVERL